MLIGKNKMFSSSMCPKKKNMRKNTIPRHQRYQNVSLEESHQLYYTPSPLVFHEKGPVKITKRNWASRKSSGVELPDGIDSSEQAVVLSRQNLRASS